MAKLQYLLYADGTHSLLVVLQALDAAGKDGTIRHVFSGMNPQGTSVFGFKQPSAAEAAHDFLWRVHQHAPGRARSSIFNRSHYEDVLVVRVHKLVPKEVWSKRYDLINEFERLLDRTARRSSSSSCTSPRKSNWRASSSGSTIRRGSGRSAIPTTAEREFWPSTSRPTRRPSNAPVPRNAPWFVIPANHKWFRNLAISQIIARTLEDMKLKTPPVRVDLASIVMEYHAAAQAPSKSDKPASPASPAPDGLGTPSVSGFVGESQPGT